MDQFFKKQKMPQLTKCEIDNFNSPITIKETAFVIKTLLEKRAPGEKKSSCPDDFTREFFQTFKEDS